MDRFLGVGRDKRQIAVGQRVSEGRGSGTDYTTLSRTLAAYGRELLDYIDFSLSKTAL